jgi:hypothetical protein
MARVEICLFVCALGVFWQSVGTFVNAVMVENLSKHLLLVGFQLHRGPSRVLQDPQRVWTRVDVIGAVFDRAKAPPTDRQR